MTRSAKWTSFFLLTASLGFFGFQCGSPEFTGAKVYINQKNFPEAIRLLEVETQKNPANEEAWFLLGKLRADRSEYKQMNAAFDEVLKLSDKNKRDIQSMRYNAWAKHTNAGVNFLQRGSSDSLDMFDLSIVEFDQAIAAWPDTSITYLYKGFAYTGKELHDSALISYNQAWEMGKEKDARKQAGRIFLDSGKMNKRAFEEANAEKLQTVKNLKDVDKGMSKADVTRLIGPPDTKKPGPRRSNREDWEYKTYGLKLTFDRDRVSQRVQEKPYDPDIDSSMYRKALEDFDQAVQMFTDVKSVDPTDNANLQSLLDAYVQSERIAEAIAGFEQAVVNDPDNKWNLYVMGVLNRQLAKFEIAADWFMKAIAADPTYDDARFDLGATYYNWGVDMLRTAQEKGQETEEYKEKFRMALPHLEQVSQNRPNDVTVWETLGTIYARIGRTDDAMKALNRADEIRKGN